MDSKKELRSLLDFQKNSDPLDNESTTLPPDELIKVVSVWVFEAFTPSFISNLRSSVKELNWSDNDDTFNPDFVEQVDQMRSKFSSWGWLNLGYITRDTNQFVGKSRKGKLPKGIDFIHASVLQYVPSTTILAFQFVIGSETAKSVSKAFKRKYRSYTVKEEDKAILHDVFEQKKAGIEAVRESIRKRCIKWVGDTFPGFFASGQFGEAFPVCEMITLRKGEPYGSVVNNDAGTILWILGLNNGYFAWQCQQRSGLYMEFSREGESYSDRIVLSGNVSKLLNGGVLGDIVDDTEESQIPQTLESLDLTIGIWVLLVLSRTYERQLSTLRDLFGSLNYGEFDLAIKEMQELDNRFLSLQRNLTPFIQEIAEFFDEPKPFNTKDFYEFFPISPFWKRK